MNKSKYIPIAPTIGDKRYKDFENKKQLDPLRIIHFNFFHRDPSITFLESEDGHATMFENGRFLGTNWYKIRGNPSYHIQFSASMQEKFTGSILISSNVINPFTYDSFSYLDKNYIRSLNGYITQICKSGINLILSDFTFKTLSFGYISLPNPKKGDYTDFIDCAMEQLGCDGGMIGDRNIIYIGDDIKKDFTKDEIKEGEEMIKRGRNNIIQYNSISPDKLEEFNEKAMQKILKL